MTGGEHFPSDSFPAPAGIELPRPDADYITTRAKRLLPLAERLPAVGVRLPASFV